LRALCQGHVHEVTDHLSRADAAVGAGETYVGNVGAENGRQIADGKVGAESGAGMGARPIDRYPKRIVQTTGDQSDDGVTRGNPLLDGVGAAGGSGNFPTSYQSDCRSICSALGGLLSRREIYVVVDDPSAWQIARRSHFQFGQALLRIVLRIGSWRRGLFYVFGFGAGMGYVYFTFQRRGTGGGPR
jgi:hypothetical protein